MPATRRILLGAALAMPIAARAEPRLSEGSPPQASGFRLATVVEGLQNPWSIAFLPDGSMLVTERPGRLRLVRDGQLDPRPIEGVPDVHAQGQGGLFEVMAHPGFARNRFIYLTYAHGDSRANRTRLARGVLEGNALRDVRPIFEVDRAKPGNARQEEAPVKPMSVTRRAALLAAPTLAMAGVARAQNFTRPIRIIVPYTPGGVSDITARLIADPMAASLGVAVPVENRAGADGVIGTDVIAKAPADGTTLGLVSVAHPVNAAFYRLPFDTMRDFSFISLTTRTPLVLCAARGFAASTPAELVAHAQRNPRGHVTFAGTGGVVRLAPVLFAQRTGIEMTYVPYRGSTQAHPDLIAGRVDIMFDTVPAALPHIRWFHYRRAGYRDRSRSTKCRAIGPAG
ncbi:PQQ-dependent sugar dehydrogenase [Leptolyngbya sp. 15MV]|nr:PQQ-dependent sugar dehydrogenase [Leptolyngbya sp. 15MV]